MADASRARRAPFIVVEGLDGAGTTTQVQLISAHLRGAGFRTWTTREPSAGILGSAVRSAIEGSEIMTREALALGFAADRLHHMHRPGGIADMLKDGVWVISDRYVLSALAYQSAQGVDLNWLTDLNRYAMAPDVTVFVDTPIRTCFERIRLRGDSNVDLFHKREILYRVRRQYLQALSMNQFLGRLVTADGKADRYDVLRQIMGGMTEVLVEEFGLFASLEPGTTPSSA